jgi:hypothetical protein
MPRGLSQVSSAILRGCRFAALDDSIIEGTADAYLQKKWLKLLSLREMRRVDQLKTMTELRVTPPDDGNRKPQPGEKKGRKITVAKGLLAPPVRKSRAGKQLKERQRIEKMKMARNRSIMFGAGRR